MTMAEELPSPFPSGSSPHSLKRRTAINNVDIKDHCSTTHHPTLPLCPPFPSNLEVAINGVPKTNFPIQKSFTFSPKKLKTFRHSQNPHPLFQEHVNDTNLDVFCSLFSRIESEKLNGNFELGECSKKCSLKKFVVNDAGKASKICKKPESEEKNENLDRLLHRMMKSRFSVSNADRLNSSVKVEVVDETALIELSTISRKIDQKRWRKVDSDGCKRKSFMYSRKEMEVFRFINVKRQKKFWQKIYSSFCDTVKREYDQLGSFRHHHKPGKRLENPSIGNYYGRGILGMAAARGTCYSYPNHVIY